jgi:phosphatidylglycerophosphate synthase
VHIVGVRLDPRPTRAGKLATFCQVVTVLLGLVSRYAAVDPALQVAMWLAAIFTIYSGCQYLVQGMRFLNSTERDEHEASLRS